MDEKQEEGKPDAVRLIKRIGAVGFLFFLVKGLLWLLVPALVYYLAT